MSPVTTKMISELRARTGAGMMDCKKALEEAGGDMDKAVDLLRQKGQAKGDKRSGRETSEGAVAAHITADGKNAGIVELNSETDFVAMNAEFQALATDLAREVAESGEVRSTGRVKELSGKTGEHIAVRRSARIALQGPGVLERYVHFNGQVGVVIEVACPAGAVAQPDVRTLVKDITLHIASTKPLAVTVAEVPADVVERERRVYEAQVAEQGKPEAIRPKIVEGMLRKFYEERVLLEQPFVKDDKVKIRDLLKQAGAEVTVRRFICYEVGGA